MNIYLIGFYFRRKVINRIKRWNFRRKFTGLILDGRHNMFYGGGKGVAVKAICNDNVKGVIIIFPSRFNLLIENFNMNDFATAVSLNNKNVEIK